MVGAEEAAEDAYVLALKLSPRLRGEVPEDIRKKVVTRARR